MSTTVIFVGDAPSAKNLDPNVPFVGTQSYKRLLEWIGILNIDVTNVMLCNSAQIDTYGYIPVRYIRTPNINYEIFTTDKVVALGNVAEARCRKIEQPYFKLPHPSGRNRQLNSPKYVAQILEDCRKWLHNEA